MNITVETKWPESKDGLFVPFSAPNYSKIKESAEVAELRCLQRIEERFPGEAVLLHPARIKEFNGCRWREHGGLFVVPAWNGGMANHHKVWAHEFLGHLHSVRSTPKCGENHGQDVPWYEVVIHFTLF